jgi:hypothetical protein
MTKPNEEEINALYHMIGFITVTWSLLERGLDRIALTIYRGCEGNMIKPRVPQPLEPKLNYIEDCFNKLEVLTDFQIEGLAIVSKARELKSKRHALIHGAIFSLTSENGIFTFTKYDFDKKRAKLKSIPFSPSDFGQLATDVQTLAANTAYFSDSLINTFLQHIE